MKAVIGNRRSHFTAFDSAPPLVLLLNQSQSLTTLLSIPRKSKQGVIGNRTLAKAGAGETTVGRFEKEILLEGDNLGNLDEILKRWTEKIDSVRGMKEIILDIDSSESPVYGEQEGSSYNGHFLSRFYHPLLVFNQYGDCLKVKLRPGNVHSADGWQEFLEPTLRSYAGKGIKDGNKILQPARNLRAVDKRGKICLELDQA